MTNIHKDFRIIRTTYKVTAFLQGSSRMHSLNPIFVLSTASCLSSLKANLSAYSLGSNFPPFLSASLQELFPFASAFILYLSFGINSIFLSLKIHSVPLHLLNYCPFFFSSRKFSKECYTCISTSYFSPLLYLQSCFCSLSRATM